MTVPNASTYQLLEVAEALGCVGVELRNDLGRTLFEGEDATAIATTAAAKGQRILALAEVKAFNKNPDDKQEAAQVLIHTAVACGAEGVALIPAVASEETSRDDQRIALRRALDVLQPLLQNVGLKGLIEPLGFPTSTLRFKEDVVAVLDDMHRPACFGIVHDTFHHHVAGEASIYADLTAIVHISGVTDPVPKADQMTDAHRVLVDRDDRLDNIEQLRKLNAAGYTGPASFEAFAPSIHDMKDPTAALAGSIAFINSQLADVTVGAA
ncbi:TIM barrel protein [Yoonia sp. GPGPB17]|uniref:TIM barrel protein n=1 Tax=Yoonia sp. GPGPB17 TaxID=3026147 RepID=UPI0030C09354